MFILNLEIENDLNIEIISNKVNKPTGLELQLSFNNNDPKRYLIYDKKNKNKLFIFEIKEQGKIIELIKEIEIPVEFMFNRIEFIGDGCIVMIDYIENTASFFDVDDLL